MLISKLDILASKYNLYLPHFDWKYKNAAVYRQFERLSQLKKHQIYWPNKLSQLRSDIFYRPHDKIYMLHCWKIWLSFCIASQNKIIHVYKMKKQLMRIKALKLQLHNCKYGSVQSHAAWKNFTMHLQRWYQEMEIWPLLLL